MMRAGWDWYDLYNLYDLYGPYDTDSTHHLKTANIASKRPTVDRDLSHVWDGIPLETRFEAQPS